MAVSFAEQLIDEIGRSPLLAELNDLARQLVGVGVTLVVKRQGVPFEFRPAGTPPAVPDFCQLIVGNGQGQRRCMLCHALVSVTPASQQGAECACHSGVCMIVVPLPFARSEGLQELLLTTAAFKRGPASPEWRTVQHCLRGLGLDPKALKATYDALPTLDSERVALAQALMACASKAVTEMVKRVLLEHRLSRLEAAGMASAHSPSEVENEVRLALFLGEGESRPGPTADAIPPLVKVASEVVARNPSLPFTVAAIARAERISPNYFSNLFHRSMGRSFKQYLDDIRLSQAETLLRNLTFSIQEVAAKAGFADTGYFIRWFKRKRHATPRAWRHAL